MTEGSALRAELFFFWYTGKIMDLNKIPKQFCENVNIGATPEYFILALSSGEHLSAYTLTPQHAKRLTQSLAYNIEQFEKRYGEIKTEWTPGIQSPIQMIGGKGDGNKNDKGKGKK
jgi:hypothetical protein